MSLLDKASLVVTPNAYKTSKLYSVVPSDGSGDMTVTRATTATRVNSAGLIESVAVNVPRLDYLNSNCPSLLVEPQRTNNFLYSEQFDNIVWITVGGTITANSIIAPDGTLTADKLVMSNGQVGNSADGVGIRQLIDIGSNSYTFSIFAKAGEFSTLRFRENQVTGAFLTVNLLNGVITNGDSNQFINAKSELYSNGWYRVSFQTPTLTALYKYSVRVSETGNGTSGIYLWGYQSEAGSYPTSYIPTVASTVTRNADVISKTGISSLIGQTEGTIYAEIKVNKLIGTASRYIFHISDGTANNRIYMAFSGSSSNILRGRIFNSGTLQCSIDSSTITTTGTYKLALAYKNNDIVFYINGVQIGVDTSASIPTCSKVDIGHNYAGASQLGDNIVNANIFKTRLTNSELQSLTTL